MPPQDRVRIEQCSELLQQPSPQYLTLDGHSTPLVVVEQDAALPELFLQHLILSSQILDDLLLLLVDPTRQDDEAQLPGLKKEIHERACLGEEGQAYTLLGFR